jgi:hypothetical protein
MLVLSLAIDGSLTRTLRLRTSAHEGGSNPARLLEWEKRLVPGPASCHTCAPCSDGRQGSAPFFQAPTVRYAA